MCFPVGNDLGRHGARRFGGPKGRPIIALGNAQGIESAL